MSLNKLDPRLRDFVKDKKWNDLTPIQKEAFDPIYQGNSCIIEAPTSGGKTEAVIFPLLTRMVLSKTKGFKVLYIAPLKALLNDLELRIMPYAKKCSMEAFKWHGDVSQGEKVQQMLYPSDILLTTPESIEAILLRKSNWVDVFQNLETIVIDEAHYFALTERGAHLVALLERIEAGIKKSPQRIAVSATVGNPKNLLQWLMSNRLEGKIIRQKDKVEKKKDYQISFINSEDNWLHNTLYRLLLNKKSIVFERSRTATEDTATKINEQNSNSKMKVGVKVKTHHSSVSKMWRESAESSIKKTSEGSLDAIISTSTLELGIDIGDLDQVIQIEGLNSSGSFLQRVGRTGRREGRSQVFRGLCFDPDEMVLLIGCVSLGLKHVSEFILFPHRAFHILAHQVICLCLQMRGADSDQIWQILSKASCFSKVTRYEFDTMIRHMIQEDYLRLVEHNILIPGNKTESDFLRANWKRLFAVFDTGPMYDVVDGKKIIGTLDSGFARDQELPFVFVLGGQEWNTIKLDHETQQVLVKKNETGIAPKWKTIGNFDVPYELAQEIGRLLTSNKVPEFLDPSAQIELRRLQNMHSNLGWDDNKWIIDISDEISQMYLWTFSGHKINRALAKIFEVEFDIKARYDHLKIIVELKDDLLKSKGDFYKFFTALQSRSESSLEKLLEDNTKCKWFSKFSECLPESLAIKTIFEKGMDLSGLIRELNRVTVVA
jgi:ATP-dependent helicase Lhr and Lhr-like helicase